MCRGLGRDIGTPEVESLDYLDINNVQASFDVCTLYWGYRYDYALTPLAPLVPFVPPPRAKIFWSYDTTFWFW